MSAFTVGQRVTVLSDIGRPVAITTVRLISHKGTRVHLAGSERTYNKHGGSDRGSRIVEVTPEHEEVFERERLFADLMSAVYDYSDEARARKRAAVTTATLRAIVALLKGEVQP